MSVLAHIVREESIPDVQRGYAFNKTRQSFLATAIRVANTHWSRLRGLMAAKPAEFAAGQGLWIVPCRGIHTLAMRFAIDAVYLDQSHKVIHIEEGLRPWRVAPVRMNAATVLELPEHTVWHSGTKLGDQIEFNFLKGPETRVRG
jgi:hypothetical protein